MATKQLWPASCVQGTRRKTTDVIFVRGWSHWRACCAPWLQNASSGSKRHSPRLLFPFRLPIMRTNHGRNSLKNSGERLTVVPGGCHVKANKWDGWIELNGTGIPPYTGKENTDVAGVRLALHPRLRAGSVHHHTLAGPFLRVGRGRYHIRISYLFWLVSTHVFQVWPKGPSRN